MKVNQPRLTSWACGLSYVITGSPYLMQKLSISHAKVAQAVVTQMSFFVFWSYFVEFSHLHFDTPFLFRDYRLTTFDTDLWEMVQIQKLQMRKYHAGIISEYNCHARRNLIPLPESTGHWAVVNRLNDARKFKRINRVDCGQV